MFKLLVLCCLLFSCQAGAFELPSWIHDALEQVRAPRGCADRAAGWIACARVNGSDALAPHPHDCHLFYYCSSAGAKPACRRCPHGLQFNPELQVCDWPDHVNCTATPYPPRPRPTGLPNQNGTTPYPPSSHVPDPETNLPPMSDAPETDGTTQSSESIAFTWPANIPWGRK